MENIQTETTVSQASSSELPFYAESPACTLCGSKDETVHFKGKAVCEDCLDLVKELYK
jgi:hypothetical protein